jgi:GrpB-like predicted nucleotidyltransferase (UPF0157 family)
MKNNYFYCHEWTQELQNVANELIGSIHDVAPELEVLFMGAGALRLPGKNDIDLDILCDVHDLKRYVHVLMSVLGAPEKLNDDMAIWDYEHKGFEIDAILSDPNTPGSHVPTQKRRFEKLKASSELQEQYRQLKLECDGLPYAQYETKKKAFLEEVVGL